MSIEEGVRLLEEGIRRMKGEERRIPEPVVLKPLEVAVVDGKLDKALRKLKKKVAAEGVVRELKRRRRASTPSEKRRRKRADAARRRRKRARTAERSG